MQILRLGVTVGSVTVSVLLFVFLFSTQSIHCFCDQNRSYANFFILIKQTVRICCTNFERINTNEIQPSVPFLNLMAQ